MKLVLLITPAIIIVFFSLGCFLKRRLRIHSQLPDLDNAGVGKKRMKKLWDKTQGFFFLTLVRSFLKFYYLI